MHGGLLHDKVGMEEFMLWSRVLWITVAEGEVSGLSAEIPAVVKRSLAIAIWGAKLPHHHGGLALPTSFPTLPLQ